MMIPSWLWVRGTHWCKNSLRLLFLVSQVGVLVTLICEPLWELPFLVFLVVVYVSHEISQSTSADGWREEVRRTLGARRLDAAIDALEDREAGQPTQSVAWTMNRQAASSWRSELVIGIFVVLFLCANPIAVMVIAPRFSETWKIATAYTLAIIAVLCSLTIVVLIKLADLQAEQFMMRQWDEELEDDHQGEQKAKSQHTRPKSRRFHLFYRC